MAQEETRLLKFTPFLSCVDPSFWHRLCQLKLDVDKLDENVHKIWGYYSNKKQEGLNQVFSVDASSFNQQPDASRLVSCGKIMNKNTIERFKEEDKKKLMKQEGVSFMEIIKTSAIEKPALLNMFLILSFADLKSYNFKFKFLFLAPGFLSYNLIGKVMYMRELFSDIQIAKLYNSYKLLDMYNKEFFFIKVSEDTLEVMSVKDGLAQIHNNCSWIFGFADSCKLENPGWPLRNYLAFISYHCEHLLNSPLRILCFRLHLNNGSWQADNSLLLNLKVNLTSTSWEKATAGEDWVGWERNDKGQVATKTANLRNFLDPMKMAEASVDLNLKLMKWQLLPDLDLDIIKSTKCLLLGAGTLGCSVARNLLAWGVLHFTFVDYGNVSYSNPVRQSLYKFKDSGSPKAKAAATALMEIYPNVISKGLVFSIPMPGHPVGQFLKSETVKNIETLENLIENHDVIFLLMDSRESRWLPTVIAAAKGKQVVNSALGFDSFLVMRHGLKIPTEEEKPKLAERGKMLPGSDLGCYFCNDVTAPGDSSKSRTLDQQCTVTRPGISNVAGALAVELFISILQHPKQGLAPAESDPDEKGSSLLGIVPHSIRGFMSHYQVLLPATEAFNSCVACSSKVINEYRQNGIDFVLKAIESKDYLEELCGLRELCEESRMSILEYSDSEPDT